MNQIFDNEKMMAALLDALPFVESTYLEDKAEGKTESAKVGLSALNKLKFFHGLHTKLEAVKDVPYHKRYDRVHGVEVPNYQYLQDLPNGETAHCDPAGYAYFSVTVPVTDFLFRFERLISEIATGSEEILDDIQVCIESTDEFNVNFKVLAEVNMEKYLFSVLKEALPIVESAHLDAAEAGKIAEAKATFNVQERLREIVHGANGAGSE